MPRTVAPILLPLAAFVRWDVALAGVFAAGSLVHDPRLEVAPGVALNQFLLFLSAGALLWLIRANRARGAFGAYAALVAVTAAILGATVLYSPAIEYGWTKWVHFVGFGTLGIVWIARVEQTASSMWAPLLLLGGVGLALGLGGLLQYARAGDGDRMALLGGGPIVFARWVGTGLIVLFCWLAAPSPWRLPGRRLAMMALGGGLLFALLLAGSKGPLLGLLLAAAYVGNVLLRDKPALLRLGAGILAITLPLILLFHLDRNIFVRLLLSPFAEVSRGSWGIRAAWLGEAWRLTFEQPWHGSGLGGWAMIVKHADAKIYPHNLAAELLVEAGPILGGGLLVIWLHWAVVWWRKLPVVGGGWPLALKALILFWSVNAMFSGDLTDNRVLILLLGFLWLGSRSSAANGTGEAPLPALGATLDENGR